MYSLVAIAAVAVLVMPPQIVHHFGRYISVGFFSYYVDPKFPESKSEIPLVILANLEGNHDALLDIVKNVELDNSIFQKYVHLGNIWSSECQPSIGTGNGHPKCSFGETAFDKLKELGSDLIYGRLDLAKLRWRTELSSTFAEFIEPYFSDAGSLRYIVSRLFYWTVFPRREGDKLDVEKIRSLVHKRVMTDEKVLVPLSQGEWTDWKNKWATFIVQHTMGIRQPSNAQVNADALFAFSNSPEFKASLENSAWMRRYGPVLVASSGLGDSGTFSRSSRDPYKQIGGIIQSMRAVNRHLGLEVSKNLNAKANDAANIKDLKTTLKSELHFLQRNNCGRDLLDVEMDKINALTVSADERLRSFTFLSEKTGIGPCSQYILRQADLPLHRPGEAALCATSPYPPLRETIPLHTDASVRRMLALFTNSDIEYYVNLGVLSRTRSVAREDSLEHICDLVANGIQYVVIGSSNLAGPLVITFHGKDLDLCPTEKFVTIVFISSRFKPGCDNTWAYVTQRDDQYTLRFSNNGDVHEVDLSNEETGIYQFGVDDRHESLLPAKYSYSFTFKSTTADGSEYQWFHYFAKKGNPFLLKAE